MSFTVVIPARFASTRFPGKPLADIQGKPMVQHVVERANEAGAGRIIVATDDERIARVAEGFTEVCMTDSTHTSGTERIAQVLDITGLDDDSVVVNVQGDEPFVPADNIRQVAHNLMLRPSVSMTTLATPIHHPEEVSNPNVVKVVMNEKGHALYFSRSVIPFERDRLMNQSRAPDPRHYLRHIGLYGYRAGYVRRYVSYPASQLEQLESLEQLRALWYGDTIHVEVANAPPPVGIDTPEDLVALLEHLNHTNQE
ncbi:3-deoxy-manno-octulosonate cytidylyltransferase [Alteromonas aestuariivivens]|uniref:3-deoxy-manno-octulosonate cytidylyltransferase n=1 Tax=Alteromonas aestuariivivens TaxID=1938339 RepID=A0A3D8M9U9_9ALTE|nr:3-deoxy-manno-octulosonate cytidylyltransferase [Alteromonas aestuariivivens]RDV26090.1 3-deoxy-manno-octulosonate cytidylyltransferase [Alteromonas aestuariivivens]